MPTNHPSFAHRYVIGFDGSKSDGVNAGPFGPNLTPKINVVRTKAGYLGQVEVAGEIAWESKPYATPEKAGEKAEAHRTKRLVEAFA